MEIENSLTPKKIQVFFGVLFIVVLAVVLNEGGIPLVEVGTRLVLDLLRLQVGL